MVTNPPDKDVAAASDFAHGLGRSEGLFLYLLVGPHGKTPVARSSFILPTALLRFAKAAGRMFGCPDSTPGHSGFHRSSFSISFTAALRSRLATRCLLNGRRCFHHSGGRVSVSLGVWAISAFGELLPERRKKECATVIVRRSSFLAVSNSSSTDSRTRQSAPFHYAFA